MKDYNFVMDEVRSSKRDGKRYARVRAIANGTDSYNTIFTTNARTSLIEQMKNNGVKAHGLHAHAINSNIINYLSDRASKAITSNEQEQVRTLLSHMPNTEYPIGNIIDAKFVDDNTVEAIIEENYELRGMGVDYANYLDASWDMIENGKLGGVSVVFNGVETFENGGKTYIDKLNLNGLDFVDRPAHTQTRVLDVFMRAAEDSRLNKKVDKMTDEKTIDVDEITRKAEEAAKIKAKEVIDNAANEAKVKADADAEAIRKKEEDSTKTEVELLKEQLLEKDKELANIRKESNEIESIAEQALEKAKEYKEEVVKYDNPFHKQPEQEVSELKDKSIAELMAMKNK